jgi:hypothetical protein
MPSYITPKHATCGILINFLVILIAVGCTASISKQPYENLEIGLMLEKPSNWDLAYSERNGVIYLEAKKGVLKKDVIRIQIHGGSCLSNLQEPTTPYNTPKEEIEWNIRRMKMLYNLESITIIQEPMADHVGSNEVTKAVIELPAAVLEEGSSGNRGSDASQIVNMFQINDGDKRSVMAYVFQSNNEELNTQAEEIIDSIQFKCPDAP